MLTALSFAASFVAGLLITPVVRHWAHRLNLLDQPGPRKVHLEPVPRLGGVAMAIAFAIGVALTLLWPEELNVVGGLRPNRAPAILAGAALLVAVGIWDDVRGMRASVKLFLQVAAAAAVWWLGLRLDHLTFPWGTIELGAASLPLTVAWVVAVINAVNLLDGLDGLAAGTVLTALGAFIVLAAMDGVDPSLPIIAATAGAAIGFLAYNLHPASIIMGDTGSMFLGFVVASVSISLTQDGVSPLAPWVPIIALGLPIADMLWAVVRRTASGEPLFRPDRGHIHHQLLRLGLSHRDAMLTLTAVSAGLAIAAALVAQLPEV